MNLPKLAVDRPITTAMLLISVLVMGGIALAELPLAYLPEVDAPFIGVQVPYPNSNPQQVEKEIVKPVEEILATLSGVKTLNAQADPDQAQFFLEFDWGQELDIVRMQVSEKMDQIKPMLPDSIGEIVIFSFNTNDMPVVQARVSAKGVDLAESYDLIEARILNRLRRVPGVARVTLDGVAPKEVTIALVLEKVRQHNVDIGQLIQRLQGASSNLVLGQIEDGGLRFTARAVGEFQSVAEIGELVIDERGLKIRDIAEIDYEEPPYVWERRLNQQPAIALEVNKESTANTVDVVRAVMGVIENDINNDPLLEGVTLFVWEDQGEEIMGGLAGLLKAGTIGALLAIFSLYFFLRRFDSTLIVSLSIPFSILAASGIMFFLGKTLNVLSMMGLMLAVGMLVDNAVVVLESIDRTHRREKDRKKAALFGARSVSTAVTASTVTTLIVFLPLIIGARTGLTTWLKEIGITIAIALACSLFSSLTLIPLMSAHFLGKKKAKEIKTVSRMEERYARMLGWTLGHRWWTALILAGVVGLTITPLATGLVEGAVFSGTINERIVLSYEFYDHTYKSEAREVVKKIEPFLWEHREEWEIASLYSFFMENRAETTMTLKRKNMTDDEIRDLKAKIREALPEVAGVRFYFDDDADTGGSSTFFAVKFFGQDTSVLEGLANEAQRRIETLDGVQDLRTSFRDSQNEVEVKIDRDKASRAGLDARDVADIFSFTLGAMRLPRFNTGEREVDTWLALRIEDRENIEDLRQLQIGGAAGDPDGSRPIRLGEIAEFRIIPKAKQIVRENRKVRVAVYGTYEGDDWNDTQEAIGGLMDAFDMPAGYSWGWNDRIVEQQDQNAQMGQNFLLAFVLVFLVMASLFESLSQPFAILFSILFAMPGAFWMLAATGTPLNLMGQIGFLILMGIVVNNGIVLLDHINQLRRSGMERDAAVLQAGRDRLRPILMTAATTIIGLLPLAVRGPATSGIFYYPLARTVIGGLISSAILTLLVTPYLAILFESFGEWLKRLWRVSGQKRALEATASRATEAKA